MSIPKIIHQTWKTTEIPRKFRRAVASVQRYHPDWEYRLWTDADIDVYVRENHPDFYPIFCGFSLHIMRVDVVRYLILNDIGGVYCDLDYEFLRPYDYSGYEMILSLERDTSFGDRRNCVSNYIMASRPGHPLWQYVIADLTENPPKIATYVDVLNTTGPGFLSRVFFSQYTAERWPEVKLTPRPVFSPYRVHGKHERKLMLNSGMTWGFHLGSGTWKERFTLAYLKNKVNRFFTKGAAKPQM